MSPPTDGRLATRLGATFALAVYSAVVAAGFTRVFEDTSFAVDMAVVIVVGHGISVALRRVYLVLALPVQVLVLTWLLAALRYPDTLRAGAPGSSTWQALSDDLTVVRGLFANATAPVPYDDGWAAMAMIGLALSIVLAEVFAFRARTRFESLVPGGVLFVIVGALGTGDHQVVTAMAVVVAGVVAVASVRIHQIRPSQVMVGRRALAPVKVLAGAVPLAVVAAGVAGAVGPSLPGSDGDALYEPVGGSGDTTIGSPLVDIRSRLVDQSDTELFRVDASESAYWRLTTLSEFDGRTWQLPERTVQEADDQLSAAHPSAGVITQEIEISGLGGRLVPAAAEPIRARGTGLRWNQESATLLAGDGGYSRGERFTIESAAPVFTPAQLMDAASGAGPGAHFRELPDGLPDVVGDTADEVTAGATNDYQRARLLQDWFRAEFSYSLEVLDGHGNDAIVDFLDRRVGYCEQFAGTFAAMARHLGMPARVAVGYTPGAVDAEGMLSVAGRNAHAWPEVWFDGYGWVPFEPTPGRGIPGAEQHTGVPRAQAEPGDGSEGDVTASTEQQADTQGTAPGGGPDDAPPPLDAEMPDVDGTDPAAAADGAVGGGGSGGQSAALWVLAVGGGGAALGVIPAVIRHLRRRRRRSQPTAAIASIWSRLGSLLVAGGVQIDPSRTPSEVAAVAVRTAPMAAGEVRSLTDTVDRSLYGPDEVDAGAVARCERDYHAIERAMANLIGPGQRLWRYLTAFD